MKETSKIVMKGHVKITDDDGNVIVDKDNAIHPQNMARVISRGLANESNGHIWRIAFGNGGTDVTAANTIQFREPNDGQPPDQNTWNSRLYNEVYSEIVDEGRDILNPDLGKDPGHSDVNGQRPGGGAVPSKDPDTILHVSGPGVRSYELGLTSEVVITCVLNQDEPQGQFPDGIMNGTQPFESSFVFDEIGLYSGGAAAGSTASYQNINVGDKNSTDSTLMASQEYDLIISADGGSNTQRIRFTPPATGGSAADGSITFGDLCEALNTTDANWNVSAPLPGGIKMYISDNAEGSYPSINGVETYGFLQFRGNPAQAGSNSSILVDPSSTMIAALPADPSNVLSPIAGTDAGIQNNPVSSSTERERLLSHIIFSPVLKAKNRTLTITYTLTISVARNEV